ncbi:chalcone isomerase [Candidatus Pseudothioglobus singularis PS1]|uniref:Chalcone isomerase n=2 Tax=Candidatus Pseudothioglobus TaxID=2841677 RepID=A0A0M3T257_9GAMM|nr:chalcone isomerase [Candidatus Pseudothioglobus singularis PS1]
MHFCIYILVFISIIKPLHQKNKKMNSIVTKIFTAFFIFGIFLSSPSIGAVAPDQIDYKGNTITKNGQGTRIIFFMKVYEGSLYLETKNSNAKEIINMDAPMAIRIDVLSSIVTADAMKRALSEGLEKSTGNNTDPIRNEMEQLSSVFNTDVSTGDFYEFIYLPKTGINVLKNSELEELIKGMDFKKAFFGIFLSDNPIQKNLKKAMLGG